MSATVRHVSVPRATDGGPSWFALDPSAPVPVRSRDDLDPYSPPLEYSDGRISWDGHRSREERDAARAAAGVSLEARRSASSPELDATRRLKDIRDEIAGLREAIACEAVNKEWAAPKLERLKGAERYQRHLGGRESLYYAAGLCWFPHSPTESCAGCEATS